MNHHFKFTPLIATLALLLALPVHAGGPPFLTDDPEPLDYQHWETYIFTIGNRSAGHYTVEGPALEVNYGAIPDVQLHWIAPMTTAGGNGSPARSGLGDMELGVKYRFVHETNGWPQIGVFPFVELPTGNANRGLGNGRVWYQLPLWVQKSWGPWMTDIGGGAALNSAPGQRDHPYGGWLLQRTIGDHLNLGGEVFAQGRDTDTDHGFVALNFGGSYNFNEHFSLLFSAGHSIAGDNQTLWYSGLYWTW